MTQDQIIERQYAKLCRKLIRQLDQLEQIGENEMGILHRRVAGRYHTITRNLRKLVNEMTQDVYFPDEPIGDDPLRDADERRAFIAELEDTCGDCGIGAGEHADDCPRL